MRNRKILWFGVFTLLAMACTSEKAQPEETNLELINTDNLIKTENLEALVKETKVKLESLLNKEGFNNIFDENLFIGKLINDRFVIESGNNKEILNLHFKLFTQEIGYDVDYNSFEYVDSKQNNGYSMLVATGQCKISGQNVTLGINVIHDKNGNTRASTGGTIVTCTGCTVGCSPRRDPNGDGYCTPCDPTTGFQCVKTERLPDNESD